MAARPPVYGQMSEFQSETESLKLYVERAKIFFAANEIPDDKQPAVFLSVIGGKTYALLRSLLAPDLPQDQTLHGGHCRRTSDSIRFPYTLRQREELRAAREGGTVADLWSEEVPPVLVCHGRRFILVTDHKPLVTILGPKKGIPSLAAARLQRWAVLLSAYKYDIKFKSTEAHANADGLSRLPLMQTTAEGQSPEASVFNIAQIDCLPVFQKR